MCMIFVENVESTPLYPRIHHVNWICLDNVTKLINPQTSDGYESYHCLKVSTDNGYNFKLFHSIQFLEMSHINKEAFNSRTNKYIFLH